MLRWRMKKHNLLEFKPSHSQPTLIPTQLSSSNNMQMVPMETKIVRIVEVKEEMVEVGLVVIRSDESERPH